MIDTRRVFMMDIFDYSGHKVCTLYDNNTDVSGQAVNVVMTTERNGWKELSFDLPCKCNEAEGEVENYRMQFIKAEYRIRTWDGKDFDWFLITEPKIKHVNYSKTISVKANHIAQLLKTKNLDLEFSDDEGNNVGTAKELLTTILDGTGWHVGNVEEFKEEDTYIQLTEDPGDMNTNYSAYYTFDNYHDFYVQLKAPPASFTPNVYYTRATKYRSLKSSSKTGAFKLISNMCDLFDAKPVYRGEVYTRLVNSEDDSEYFSQNCLSCYWQDETSGMYMPVTSIREYTPGKYFKKTERVVDIMPLNPFSEPENGMYPDLKYCQDGIIEMHYGKDLSSVDRSLNTSNLVTCLHGYGSFGDKTNGYCSLETATHMEYVFLFNKPCVTEAGGWNFSVPDVDGTEVKYTFYPPVGTSWSGFSGTGTQDQLIFSLWDAASMLYVYDAAHSETETIRDHGVEANRFTKFTAYPVVKGSRSGSKSLTYIDEGETTPRTSRVAVRVQNWSNSIMNFDYYREVGLLSDEMIMKIAEYQRTITLNMQSINKATEMLTSRLSQLYSDIGVVDYVKLAVSGYERENADAQLLVNLNTTDYPHGVIYRTDYLASEAKQFQWQTTEFYDINGDKQSEKTKVLDINGDPIVKSASMVVIIHAGADMPSDEDQNDPKKVADIKWIKGFLASVDDEDNPTQLKLWINYDDVSDELDLEHDEVFLFKSSSISGNLGGLLSSDEAADKALKTSTTKVTEDHPVIFGTTAPDHIDNATKSSLHGYGWYWKQDQNNDGWETEEPVLYFCYSDDGDTDWHPVYVEMARYRVDYSGSEDGAPTTKLLDNRPFASKGDYIFDWTSSFLWRCTDTVKVGSSDVAFWTKLDTNEQKAVATLFGTVYRSCLTRNRYKFGQLEQYSYIHKAHAVFPAQGQSDKDALNSQDQEWIEARYDTLFYVGSSGNYRMYKWAESDWLYIGLSPTAGLMPGNYYISTPYQSMQLFTTSETTEAIQHPTWRTGGMTFDTIKNWVVHKANSAAAEKIITSKNYRFDNVHYHPANNLEGLSWEEGALDVNGAEVDSRKESVEGSEEKTTVDYRMNTYASVCNKTAYMIYGMYGDINIYMYNSNKEFLGKLTQKSVNGIITFVTRISGSKASYDIDGVTVEQPAIIGPDGGVPDSGALVAYIRISADIHNSNAAAIAANGLNKVNMEAMTRGVEVIVSGVPYRRLEPIVGAGENMSILRYVRRFVQESDNVFQVCVPLQERFQKIVKNAQALMTESLGDLWREGYWQDDSYTEGKERQLYIDATDNLKQIAKPEASYSVSFHDLFETDRLFVPERTRKGKDGALLDFSQLNILKLGMKDDDNDTAELVAKAMWPDLSINTAVHLIDQELDINLWAFVDKLRKCYDKPWETKLEINTNLSTIGQHSFQDVMTHIAEVASGIKGKQAVTGSISGSNVVGVINGTQIAGGTITGSQIAPRSLLLSHVSGLEEEIESAIQTWGAGLTFSTAQIQDLVAETARIAVAEIKKAKIESAQIINLEAIRAEIHDLVASSIIADSIDTDTLTAKIADIAEARIRDTDIVNAKIQDAEISYAQIKGLDTEEAFIEISNEGKTYIHNLAVTDANVDQLLANCLMIKGKDGNLHRLIVEEDGNVISSLVKIDGETIINKSINGSSIADDTITEGQIMSGTITTKSLNVAQLMSDDAFIHHLVAGVANIGNLFAHSAIAEQLQTHLLNSDYLKIAVAKEYQFSNGENLLKGTTNEPTEATYGSFCFDTVGVRSKPSNISKITFSCYVDCSKSDHGDGDPEWWAPQLTVYAPSGELVTPSNVFYEGERVTKDTPGWVTVTADVPEGSTAVKACLVSNYQMSGKCTYHSAKLEYGNVKTPWTESTADIDDRIREAELRIDPDAITATVKSRLDLSNGQNLLDNSTNVETQLILSAADSMTPIGTKDPDARIPIQQEYWGTYMTGRMHINAKASSEGADYYIQVQVAVPAEMSGNLAENEESEGFILDKSVLNGMYDNSDPNNPISIVCYNGNTIAGTEIYEAEEEIMPLPDETTQSSSDSENLQPVPEPGSDNTTDDDEEEIIPDQPEDDGSSEGWSEVTFLIPEGAIWAKFFLVYYGDKNKQPVYYHSPKLEYGEIATPWSAITNDTEARLRAAEMKITDEKIIAKVQSWAFDKDDANSIYNQIQRVSEAQLTDDELNVMFQTTKDEINSSTDTKLTNYTTWYHFDQDAMTIGKGDSDSSLELTNNQINFKFNSSGTFANEQVGMQFIDDGNVVASIGSNKMTIQDGNFKRSITIGSLQASIDDAGNNITWAWI